MTSFAPSEIEKINAAIQSYNPFAVKGAAVRIPNVWGQAFPDIPSLNAHASDAVFQAIKQVSVGKGQVTSLAINAEQGLGKTHLISRIRHRLQADGGALFVYASGSKFSDLNRIHYQFLQILGDSFNQIGSQGVKQWQELATAMLNQVVKKPLSPKEAIERFPDILQEYGMDSLTQEICELKPQISDPDIVRAILWTLSKNHALHAIKWLSGNDLAEAKAALLELPNPDKDDRETKAFDKVLQILSLIGDYSALIICFDELEISKFDDGGLSLAQIVASELVKNLFDSLSLGTGSRGVVILTVMIPDIWTLKIKALPGGIPYKVSTGTPEPIELKPIDADSIVELVNLWMKEFYQSKNLIPHHPLYPFEETKLRELAKERPAVRKVLHWCEAHFQVPGDGDDKRFKIDPVEAAFNNELLSVEASIDNLLDDKTAVANALSLVFCRLIGQTREQVKIDKIEAIKSKTSEKSYNLDFKIIGVENGKNIAIGVMVLQLSAGIGVQAGLKRLIDYKKFKLTRGCLVRSKQINDTAAKANAYLTELLSPQLGGEWVKLTKDNIKPLLAIQSVYLSRLDYELSEEQIFEFIANRTEIANNYLICEILSDPSGIIPTGLAPQ
ncbi:P-loop NTPase fold protein [Aerosakkonema sp. BLCC-F183]|uniref:P-loop NTPase fold protein n=1 Tax=Aerosakkonema sp. BLCC-F183 TaxID=3342834 RepID=UPI0035B6F450